MKTETWKEVPATKKATKRYFVSNLGRCKSVDNFGEKIIRGKIAAKNCVTRIVNYTVPNRGRMSFNISRDIYSLFHGVKLSANDVILLKNPSKGFALLNLIRISKEAQGHANKHNLKPFMGTGVVTNSKINEIMASDIKKSTRSNNELSLIYGISSMQVSRIRRGIHWANQE